VNNSCIAVGLSTAEVESTKTRFLTLSVVSIARQWLRLAHIVLVFYGDLSARWTCCLVISVQMTRHRVHCAKTSTKPEVGLHNVIATPPEEERATITVNMHKNMVKFGCMVAEIRERRDKQTRLSVLCTALEAK